MNDITLVTGILIAANVLISLRGFNDIGFADRFTFHVGPIRGSKEYIRMLSAGFLHVDWTHLIFNMLTLFFFGPHLETFLGPLFFAILYFASLIAGNLFALTVHRTNPNYRAVGASGAVSGVIFAAIACFPGIKLGFILLPIPIPGWLFGLGYVLYSIYGMRSGRDNIGHEAHLGGGIAGLLIAIGLVPQVIQYNYITILIILIPSILFLVYTLFGNRALEGRSGSSAGRFKTMDDKYREQAKAREKELDRILEKIADHGRDSLTQQEKDFLERYN